MAEWLRRVGDLSENELEGPMAGFLETLDNIKREDILAFYGRYFRPERATLVVVGDVEPEEIVSLAQETLGGWKVSGEEPEPYSVPE